MNPVLPTSMDTEDLIVDHHAQGEKVKHIGEVVPNARVSVFA